jgi:integrase/recombinase XerC
MRYAKSRDYVITHQKVLSPEESAHLVGLCTRLSKRSPFAPPDPRDPHVLRNCLMLMLALECGLRAHEVLDLEVRDINVEVGSLYIRSQKHSNARELPIKPTRARQLRRYVLDAFNVDEWHQLDPNARVFNITYSTLREIWIMYRPHPAKKLHSLRHTFAVNLYLKTKDILVVKLALGHRCIDNTMVYVDFCYSQTILRQMMHG